MVRNVDHVTVCVRDAAAGLKFFALLGFREEKSVVIAGSPFDAYMSVPGIEAEHRTLVLQDSNFRQLIQLANDNAGVPPDVARDVIGRIGGVGILVKEDDQIPLDKRVHGRLEKFQDFGVHIVHQAAGQIGPTAWQR